MASTTRKINWNTDPIPASEPLSALVQLPDGHGLQLIATGPPRQPNQPVVIFEAGFGSDAYEFAAVMRLVAEMGIVRCFAYNRMATQESELRSDLKAEFDRLMKELEEEVQKQSSKEDEALAMRSVALNETKGDEQPKKDVDEEKPGPMITAMDCVRELSALLVAADIPGPYITVSHSWGGIIMCQFLALRNPPIPLTPPKDGQRGLNWNPHAQVVGMVFIDANQESSHDNRDINQLIALDAILGPLNQNRLLDYETRCIRPGGMTYNEWMKCNDERFWPVEWKIKKQIMVGGMIRGWDESISTLKSHQILKQPENGYEPALTFLDPLSGKKKGGYVIALFGVLNKDESQLLYEEAVKRGYGTEEQLALFRDLIESVGEPEREMQRGFMKLAAEGNGRFADATKSAHNVHRTEPELVAGEIRWIVEQLEKM